MIVRWLCLTALILLTLSLPACMRDAKTKLVGKWEASLHHKRTDTEVKMLLEFLPDGTFTAAPLNDPVSILDKDKYETSADGQTVKIRSQMFGGELTCAVGGSTMNGETEEYLVKFKKL